MDARVRLVGVATPDAPARLAVQGRDRASGSGAGAARTVPPGPLVALALAILAVPVAQLLAVGDNGYGALDYRLYMDATARWLGGGPFYEPYQLTGPYAIQTGDVLYPPVALWLFVPFTVLPAVVWWAVPLAITAWSLWRSRPDPMLWPLLALCVAWPPTVVKLVTGNPVMWAMAAMALAAHYRWPAVFALLKPSLAPLALYGADRRSWWLALGAFALLSLPFGALWIDWLATVLNSRGGGLGYSVLEVPMLLFPILATVSVRSLTPARRRWAGSTSGTR